MRRRKLVQAGVQSCLWGCVGAPALALAAASTGQAAGAPQVLRFGTTPVFLDDQIGFLSQWSNYLGEAIGMPVRFVQRRAYRDIMGLLRSGNLEAAWICGFPWVVNRSHLRGLSLPMYQGEPWYQSYLIVPTKDSTTQSLRDLRQRTYAFSDPDSNSGYLVPRTTLIDEKINPDQHFRRTFFAWGHRNVVSAVATGLSDGGSVDGYVWDTLQRIAPAMVGATRVAWRSERCGFPPIAVRASLPVETERRLRDALFGMAGTPVGRRLLAELNLTSFGEFKPEVFDGIARRVAVANSFK